MVSTNLLVGLLFVNFQLLVFAPSSSNSLNISTDVKDIKFYLYPKQGDSSFRQEIKYKHAASLSKSSFKQGALTVFIVHGYNNNADSPQIKVITDAYVNSSFGANYIVMDWGRLAGKRNLPTDNLVLYPIAVRNVPHVGARLAKFIGWLNSSMAIDMYHVHLIGHSLGAHVVGEAGKGVIKAMDGFKLSRITGLDPAGPLFWPQNTSRNINKDDAAFVDIIHTNAFEAGEKTTEGHIDFIVNDGTNQPGCNIVSNIITSCSHTYATKLYAKTFLVSYFGCKCSHWELDPISFHECLEMCPHPVRVGLYTPHDARGIYTVKTGVID